MARSSPYVGRALLSAFLHDLRDNLLRPTSRTKAFMERLGYQRRLIDTLLILDAMANDAEEKQFRKGGEEMKGWLNELQRVVYHLEELLGHITTNTKSLKLKGPRIFRVFSTLKKPEADMKVRIRKIMESLEAMVRKKDALGLTVLVTGWAPLQDSRDLFPRSTVLQDYFCGKYPKDYFYGREEEEKSMLEILLSTSSDQYHVKVINIVGKSGAGKTAFADIIYFNRKVRESFELRAWVTVPYKASVDLLANKILEAISGTEEFIPSNDFHVLGKSLQKSFAGKKFLLVLDDCRIEDASDNWSMLIDSVEVAARGSAIILAASPVDDQPLLMSPAYHPIHLGLLSAENFWYIFLAHAFGQMNLRKHLDLGLDIQEIVTKLANLPLAAKMIGSLLRDKIYPDHWVKILRSKLLHAGDVNLPIPSFLVLCYLDLPAQLKRCFAYLSLFPKGYINLTTLW